MWIHVMTYLSWTAVRIFTSFRFHVRRVRFTMSFSKLCFLDNIDVCSFVCVLVWLYHMKYYYTVTIECIFILSIVIAWKSTRMSVGVDVVINVSRFHLLQNLRINFNQRWHKASLGDKLLNWRTTPWSIAKKWNALTTFKIFFSTITGPFDLNLETVIFRQMELKCVQIKR